MYRNMKTLKQLFCLHAPSRKEGIVARFIKNWVKTNVKGAKVKGDRFGNIYITKGSPENGSYACLVAHLDQVQKLHSKDFEAVETKDIVFGYSAANRRQEGLGADDKVGLWIGLKCLERYDALKVAFFVQEEVGCVGSVGAKMEFFRDCRFVVEPDRRGHSDLITSIGGISLCSADFLRAIEPEKFGYEERDGLMTDVEALTENGLGLSCVNVSCGYYQPHSNEEFIVKADVLKCLHFVEHIIESATEVYPHCDELIAYGEPEVLDDYNAELYDGLYDIVSSCPTFSFEDIRSYYQLNHPSVDGELLRSYYDLVCSDVAYWKKIESAGK